MSNGIPILFDGSGVTANTPAAALARLAPKVFGPMPFVHQRLPAFVREDHPKFVLFMEAYYEWLETFGGPIYGLEAMSTVADIDRSLTGFIDSFREKYLNGFPKELAVDADGNRVSPEKLIKNIRSFYTSKGSEKSFQLLFRVLLDLDVAFYYPKNDILKASDGRWIEEKSLRLSSRNGSENFRMLNRTIEQYDRFNRTLLASATVSRVLQYNIDQYEITEVFLKDINGTWSINSDVSCVTEAGDTLSESVFSVISEFEILSGGAGYRRGDSIVFGTSSGGFGGRGEVQSVTPKGKIKTVSTIEFGINYLAEENVYVKSDTGNGMALVRIVPGALCQYPGYYDGNSGKISSTKRTFDGEFYQDFAYALKSEANLERYRDAVLKLAHPTGMQLFGIVAFLRTLSTEPVHHSEHQRFEIPRIAHYLPYQLYNTEDLPATYPVGYNQESTALYCCAKVLQLTRPTTMTAGTFADLSTFVQYTSGSGTDYTRGRIVHWELLPEGVTGSTSGYLYLSNLSDSGSATGFTAGFTGIAGGNTATIALIMGPNGVVYSPDLGGGRTHDAMGNPYGTGGGASAALFGFDDFWHIYHHPNVRGIVGIDGSTSGTGAGISFGGVLVGKFLKMPFGYHFHSNPGTGPYMGNTGPFNEYSLVYGGGITSPNF